VPLPYQQPHPPIRIAGASEDTFPVLGTLGYPLFVAVRSGALSGLAPDLHAYRDANAKAGHSGKGQVYPDIMEQPPQLSELRRYFSDLQRSHLHPTSADDNTLITREDCEFRWRLLHNIGLSAPVAAPHRYRRAGAGRSRTKHDAGLQGPDDAT
jgi:alkanesulfonate monooxygenase SsuD/methylene tetrahydromethanopterin reductase-like flavin-dependent oxidoreductase (luciferase family)